MFFQNKLFCFPGGLHIEQFLLGINGDLVKGTGLDDIVKVQVSHMLNLEQHSLM